MKIPEDVVGVLNQCRAEGRKLFLPDVQLDRSLYLMVNRVLKLAGGKWIRQLGAHLFSEDVGDRLDTLILTGEIVDTNKELQFFETPPAVVEQLIDLAELQPNDRVLEPSAGKGAIAFALLDLNIPLKVYACEIHLPFFEILSKRINSVVCCDFLELKEVLINPEPRFERVIANPPFTRQQDIDHVNHMMDVCCGRVVSVMSASVIFRDNKKTVNFRDRVFGLGGRFVSIPPGSFKESGTMVSTCIVVVDCPNGN